MAVFRAKLQAFQIKLSNRASVLGLSFRMRISTGGQEVDAFLNVGFAAGRKGRTKVWMVPFSRGFGLARISEAQLGLLERFSRSEKAEADERCPQPACGTSACSCAWCGERESGEGIPVLFTALLKIYLAPEDKSGRLISFAVVPNESMEYPILMPLARLLNECLESFENADTLQQNFAVVHRQQGGKKCVSLVTGRRMTKTEFYKRHTVRVLIKDAALTTVIV